MSAKDHPNNAPGMPMLFRPCLDRLQMTYMNPGVRRLAPHLPPLSAGSAHHKSPGGAGRRHRRTTAVRCAAGWARHGCFRRGYRPIPRTAAEICALGSTAPVRTGRLYKLTG
jgi:hypothetical protein